MALQRALVLARGGPLSAAERSVLDLLRQELPSSARVWSSIALFTPSGQAHEIDLVLLGHYGVYVVEVKAHGGWITGDDRRWIVTSSDGVRRPVPSPLELTRQKARLLAQLLQQELGEARAPVEPLVVLSGPEVEIALPQAARAHVVTPRELLRAVQFGDLPGEPLAPDRTPVDGATAAAVQRILEEPRARPRPGRGRLPDELPLLVHEIVLSVRERALAKKTPRDILDAASAWVISCGFIRALEERGLLEANLLAGQGAAGAERAFLTGDPARTASDYLRHVIGSVAAYPAGEAVLGERHNPLWHVALSDAEARAVLDFFREQGPSGKSRWSFAGDPFPDLYQEVSADRRAEHATLVTPAFIDKLLLDLTLVPALREPGLTGPRVMDPVCGSGLLLGAAFEQLHDHLESASPGADPAESALDALDRLHGADISPVAVLVTRIRLVLAYLERTGKRRLADAPRLPLHIVTADALLVGRSGEHADPALDEVFHRKYEVVVGTPPFVTCKDAARRELYRRLYPRSATGRFSLVEPFIELFWDLATEGGFVGIFASNSFARRASGKPLVEQVLAAVELTRVIDTSGAYIPGHGTPTLLLVGRNRSPQSSTVRVVAGKRGEPIAPVDPAKGEVWSSIASHHDEVGYEDAYIAVDDVPRDRFAKHPWTLAAGVEARLLDVIEHRSSRQLSAVPFVTALRAGASSGQDEVFILPPSVPERLGLEREVVRPYLTGEMIADWAAHPALVALAPYDRETEAPLSPDRDAGWWRFLWPYRAVLQARAQASDGREAPWWAWSRWPSMPPRGAPRLLCPQIASTNRFVLEHGEATPARTLQVIEMAKTASEEEIFALLGYLNSSIVCYWLKQCSYQRLEADSQTRAGREDYDFGSRVRDIPVPEALLSPGSLRAELGALGKRLDRAARERAACAPERVLSTWDGASRDALLEALGDAQMRELAELRRMVSDQEDLDWLVYEMFGLVDASLPRTSGSALPEQRPFAWLSDEPPAGLDRRLVEPWRRRREAARTSAMVQILESPAYKRPFRRLEYRGRIAEASEAWLLDRLEDVLRSLSAPRFLSAEDLTSSVSALAGVREVISLEHAAPRDAELAERVSALVGAHAVPALAASRYTAAGLEKRAAWEQTWEMQRREDAGEDVRPPVPPKYEHDARDYRDAVTWHHRGKLDVPRERFLSAPGAAPLFGWAGWNVEQRALALRALEKETEGHQP